MFGVIAQAKSMTNLVAANPRGMSRSGNLLGMRRRRGTRDGGHLVAGLWARLGPSFALCVAAIQLQTAAGGCYS